MSLMNELRALYAAANPNSVSSWGQGGAADHGRSMRGAQDVFGAGPMTGVSVARGSAPNDKQLLAWANNNPAAASVLNKYRGQRGGGLGGRYRNTRSAGSSRGMSGILQNLVEGYQSAIDKANAANEARAKEGLTRLDDRTGRVVGRLEDSRNRNLERVENFGEAQRMQNEERFAEALGNQTAQLSAAGLGGSTIRSAFEARNARDRRMTDQDLSERVDARAVQYDTDATRAIADADQRLSLDAVRFIEAQSDIAPDFNQMSSLIREIGKTGGGQSGGGGGGGRGYGGGGGGFRGGGGGNLPSAGGVTGIGMAPQFVAPQQMGIPGWALGMGGGLGAMQNQAWNQQQAMMRQQQQNNNQGNRQNNQQQQAQQEEMARQQQEAARAEWERRRGNADNRLWDEEVKKRQRMMQRINEGGFNNLGEWQAAERENRGQRLRREQALRPGNMPLDQRLEALAQNGMTTQQAWAELDKQGLAPPLPEVQQREPYADTTVPPVSTEPPQTQANAEFRRQRGRRPDATMDFNPRLAQAPFGFAQGSSMDAPFPGNNIPGARPPAGQRVPIAQEMPSYDASEMLLRQRNRGFGGVDVTPFTPKPGIDELAIRDAEMRMGGTARRPQAAPTEALTADLNATDFLRDTNAQIGAIMRKFPRMSYAEVARMTPRERLDALGLQSLYTGWKR